MFPTIWLFILLANDLSNFPFNFSFKSNWSSILPFIVPHTACACFANVTHLNVPASEFISCTLAQVPSASDTKSFTSILSDVVSVN